jgi:predicted phosphodiesterase
MSNILAPSDPHEPVSHPGYLQFCQDLYAEWQCDKVVIGGDITDHQAISFHAANPECPAPSDEYLLTKRAIHKWYNAFPNAKICIGNHDERVIRLAESVNIPAKYLRDFNEIWKTKGWDWQHEFIIDDVYYFHGTGNGGLYPAANCTKKMLMSVVMGHNHSRAGISWTANPRTRIFGMDIGCGIDVRAWQFAYGRHMKQRPILGCGIIKDGIPYHEIMPCGRGELYHHSNFEAVDLTKKSKDEE